MEISVGEAWAHRNQRAVQCPTCGSDRMRLSRRKYDGIVAGILQLKPMKCADCSAYVPVAARFLAGSLVEPDSLRVPFRPITGEVKGDTPSGDIPIPTRNRADARGACPLCGSKSVRPAAHGPLESYVSRFNAKDLYRCAKCNAAFRRTSFPKLAAMAVVFVVLLAGLTYVAVSALGHLKPSSTSPKLTRPVPAMSPPVFR